MIEQLFGSKTRVKLLKLFYANPNRSFYVREITRKIDEQINSVRRELSNLLSIGIISSDTTNNRLYYEVNQTYEYYQPLLEIFGGGGPAAGASQLGVAATAPGVAAKPQPTAAGEAGEAIRVVVKDTQDDVKKTTITPVGNELGDLLHIGNVELALYTGQFTRDESSGIDMLIVGDVNQTKLQKYMTALEEQEKKEIRYVVMSTQEFTYRRQVKDRFIITVLASKIQVLIDKHQIMQG